MIIPDDIRQISLTDTPLDDPVKMAEAAELFRAIGLAASSWSRLETHIDMALILLNQPQHSIQLHDKDHPIGFKRKVRLLKRWFNKHPLLTEYKLNLRALSPELIKLVDTRNILLHSVLSDYNPATKQAVWRSIKALASDTYSVGKHVGTIGTLIAFASEAHSAHIEFAKISREVFRPEMIERLRKSSPHTRYRTRLFRYWRAGLEFARRRLGNLGSSREAR